ncbi:uncharacterized protein LOC142624916 [Castanea sativa]|uniref:uncharacterized protein LOC142624916 n=1 Tax=Castanea sativa TaxID=21020 RepID=UPI003F64D646
MGKIVVDYYTDLLTSGNPTDFDEIQGVAQPRVTSSMNQKLTMEFTVDEVNVALKQMYPLKAPGPDGMPPLFYQHFWPKIGEEFASKAIANRMKKFLPSIISDNQSAFVHERLGFDEKWRKLVMQCVTTVTYSVRINGKPKGHITPTRGICQGDPLSPYLFLLCAEGLSSLIKKAVDDGASIEECNSLQRILTVYEEASGQQLNRAKTSLFFSSNTPDGIQQEIKSKLGAQVIRQHEKYLGLPSLVGKNKRDSFNAIKEKLSKKLAGWKEKLLSKAGKEVLIKAVAQAIPTYTMGVLKFRILFVMK